MAKFSQSTVEKFFNTVGTVAKETYNSSPSDLTIDAEIVSIVNIDRGEYKVDYQGNIMSVFSNDPTVTYKTGERVYIIVPQGDMSKKKLIFGRSSYQNNSTFKNLNAVKNFYVDQGPNWAELYAVRQDLQICACPGAEEASLISPAHFYHYGFWRGSSVDAVLEHPTSLYEGVGLTAMDASEVDEEMSVWGASNDYLKIAARFQTNLLGAHVNGKYALRVTCMQYNPSYVEDPEDPNYSPDEPPYKLVNYELSFQDFDGVVPYSITSPTLQKAYFQVPLNGIIGIHSVGLIQDGDFAFDIPMTYNDGLPVYDPAKAIKDKNNIMVSDISITFAKKVNLSDSMYYPYIEAPYGVHLYGPKGPDDAGRTSVQLIAHLQYGDVDITEQEGCTVHWFRRKADVTESSAANAEKDERGKTYFDYGGPGWYPVERIEEEQQPFAVGNKQFYKVDGNKLTIYMDAVPYKWKYKAVITYVETEKEINEYGREEVYYKELNKSYAIEEVIRSDSIYDLELIASPNELPGFYEVVDNNDMRDKWPWIGTWYEAAIDGSYNAISNPFHQGKINILDNPFSSWATIAVQCYDPYEYSPDRARTSSDVFEVAVLEMEVGSNTEEPFIIDWEGTDHFQYDAQGTWKGERDDQEYILTPVLKFVEGCAFSYSIKVIAPDGKVLGNEEYYRNASDRESRIFGYWKDSAHYLVENAYIDRYFGIHYSVAKKYDKEKAKDNTFTIVVYGSNRQQYTFKKQITFAKDGDMGTNGTEWNVTVRPCNWKAETMEGLFVEPIPESWITPLVVVPTGTDPGHYAQDTRYRLFLRPFVTRGGTPLEALDKEQGYYYTCEWDVRSPGGDSLDEKSRLSSFLRLYHTYRTLTEDEASFVDGSPSPIAGRGTAFDVANGGSWETGEDEIFAGDKWENVKMNESMKDLTVDPPVWKAVAGVPTINGLVGHTVYPLNPEARLWSGDVADNPFEKAERNECYGAVEVGYFDNYDDSKGTGSSLEMNQYRFIVKCTVNIMQTNYSYAEKRIETASYARQVTSLVCYYPVDIFFNEDNLDLTSGEMEHFEDKIWTNWPSTVKYDAIGYNPEHTDEILKFKFGPYRQLEEKSYLPYNLTPNTQVFAKVNVEYDDEGNQIAYEYKYRPVSHVQKGEGFHGAMRTIKGEWPVGDGNCWFLRNTVMYLNRYGNADINGWDGQGLDTNEEEGTMFGVTFGAGWKGKFTNAFTGVLMGVDKNVPRHNYQEDLSVLDYPQEAEESHPYLTGIFGYQEGIQSFGLLENGTAFFGRADRGGRIIIDGSNASIYGGANGMFKAPSIADPMWNTLRISLIDLNHTKDNEKLWILDPDMDEETYGEYMEGTEYVPTGYKTRDVNGDPVKVNYDGHSFGFAGDETHNGSANTMPTWYGNMWRRSYIQPWMSKPYWMMGQYDDVSGSNIDVEIEDLDWWMGEDPRTIGSSDDWKGNNKRVNYFDSSWIVLNSDELNDAYPDAPPLPAGMEKYTRFPYNPPIDGDTKTIPPELADIPVIKENDALMERLNYFREQGAKLSLSSFGAQRASTTPAIEIGQHQEGLRPGLVGWRDYESLYESQRIPGDRNFMITYDGTMWAMNGVFMGNVIGSNIVGGRIQASQIGVGPNTDDVMPEDHLYTFFANDSRYYCQWYILVPPVDGLVDTNIYASKKTGYAMTITENGITSIGGDFIGGSLDIGHFHILGYKTIERLSNLGLLQTSKAQALEEEFGHLIQTGKSDFMGVTHFYGNVGIAPSTTGRCDRSNSGSLVQVSGFTALGVILPSIDNLKSHQAVDDYINNKGGIVYRSAIEGNYGLIGEGGSVEASAVFAIDARNVLPIACDFDVDNMVRTTHGINSHFWPLHFHARRGADPDTGETTVWAYATMMNQFKTMAESGASGDDAGTHAIRYEGSNYFRVSPWGLEGQEFFVRSRFQPEDISQRPKPDDQCIEDPTMKSYRGYIGSVSRAGYAAGAHPMLEKDMGALGITTWNNNAIILHSDDNYANRTRRTVYVYANAQSDEVTQDKTITEKEGDDDQKHNMMVSMATLGFTDDDLSPNHHFGSFDVKTMGSPFNIQVIRPGTGTNEKSSSSPAALGKYTFGYGSRGKNSFGTNCGAFFCMNPFMEEIANFEASDTLIADVDQGKPAVILACHPNGKSDPLQGGGVHIYCSEAPANDCRGQQWSETFWSQNEIHSWANTKNAIFSAQNVEVGIAAGGVHTASTIEKGIKMDGSNLTVMGYTAEQQVGIYARFA